MNPTIFKILIPDPTIFESLIPDPMAVLRSLIPNPSFRPCCDGFMDGVNVCFITKIFALFNYKIKKLVMFMKQVSLNKKDINFHC